MIAVEVKLGAVLRELLDMNDDDTGKLRVELPPGSTLPDLYRALGLKPEAVAFCTVNNSYPPEDYRLQDGDFLRVMGAAVGG